MKTVALELQPCCGKRSGIGTYTYELAKRLRSDGDLAYCGNIFNFRGRNNNDISLQGISMPIYENNSFPYGVYRRIWDFVPLKYNSLFDNGADLTIFFNYIVPPNVSGKVITAIYDMTYMRYPETMDARNRRRLDNGLKRSLAVSDMILTISEFSKREIMDLMHVPEEKISIVYCAPGFTDSETALPVLSEEFGIDSEYILYVGTIEPRKNLVRLIHAYDRIRTESGLHYQLVLAGGKGWQNDEIYNAAHSSRFAKDIVFTGYITDAEKNGLYKNASVFVFPSLYEGFGMPPLEAMHFDCPVVCSDAASLPEVCGNAAELVDPSDEKSIAGGILKVLENPEYSAQLVQRGHERVTAFSWDISAQQLSSVCKEVLEIS